MHWLDIVVLLIIVGSAIEGGVRGFVFEICSLAGLILGIFLAIKFFADVAVYLDFIPVAGWILNLISFILILSIVSILFTLLGKALRTTFSKIFLGWLDHVAGVVFGVLRGVITVLLIVMALQLTPLGRVINLEAPKTRFMPLILNTVHPVMKTLVGERDHSRNVI
ncbi:MAG: CvpA family protein [bacterium]|nr:CvpA family protein [bacterium]